MDSVLGNLPETEKVELIALIREQSHMCIDKPGRTTLAEHDLYVRDAKSIRLRPYRNNPEKLASGC